MESNEIKSEAWEYGNKNLHTIFCVQFKFRWSFLDVRTT